MNLYDDKKDLMGKILIVLSFLLLAGLFALLFVKPFLSPDEWFTKSLIGMNFMDMMRIISIDVHPPLYYLIDRAVVDLFHMLHISINPIILIKIASIIPYLIILALSLTVIRKEYGLYASGLFSFSLMSMGIFFTYYLTARMYSWPLLFAILSFMTAKYILESPDIKKWIALSLFSVLGVYCVYISAFSSIVLYILLFLYFIVKDRTQIRNFIISCVLNVVLFAPWIFILYRHASKVHDDYYLKMESLNQIINTFSSAFPNFIGENIISYVFLIVLAAVIVYLAKKFYDTKDVDDYYLLSGVLVYFGTVSLFVLTSIFYKPIIVDRILIPSMGIFWMALSIALSKLEFNRIMVIITLLIVVLGCANLAVQIDDISKLHDETVDIENTLKGLNSDNNTVLFIGMQKYIRFHEYLNNTDQYYAFSIKNETHNPDYVKLLKLNNSTFKIPSDVKNSDKDVYVILDRKDKSLDHISKINTTVLNNTGIFKILHLTPK